MRHRSLGGMCLGMLTLALLPSVLLAQPAKTKSEAGDKQAAVKSLATTIDQHLAKRWTSNKLKPAARADDAEFIRRVFLDLVGQIPEIQEVMDFLDDDQPNKRAAWIDKLLDDPAYRDKYTKH